MNVGPQVIPPDLLKQGANLLSIDAHNGVGPAGLLCQVASINGKMLARGLQGLAARVGLGDTPDGPAMLRLTAEGTAARYVLSHTEDTLPAAKPEPAYVEVPIMVMRKK
jgi:hypothetical protein